MKSAGKARNNGLYRHIRTSKEIIRNLLNDYAKHNGTSNLFIYSFSRSFLLLPNNPIVFLLYNFRFAGFFHRCQIHHIMCFHTEQ